MGLEGVIGAVTCGCGCGWCGLGDGCGDCFNDVVRLGGGKDACCNNDANPGGGGGDRAESIMAR